ncbi:MAG: TrmO family methyltransferase domain-containing protein [Bacteroidales bacterium]
MTHPFVLTPIGIVRNSATPAERPGKIKQQVSRIEVSEAYREGLSGIEAHKWVVIVFGLDRIDEIHLTEPLYSGDRCGIFACRSQYRPNHLGVTTCRLIRAEGNILWVNGLDAADQSPVFDIKCPDTSEQEMQLIHNTVLINNPRHDIAYDIRNNLPYVLWLKAGQLTGSLTSALGLGVMAALHFMNECRLQHTYGEPLFLKAPTGTPLTDGALFVAGISPGSGRLLLQQQEKLTLYFSCSLFSVSYVVRDYPDPHEEVEEWIKNDPHRFFDIAYDLK